MTDLAGQPDTVFLAEAARYFRARDTGGEDRAFYANQFNAENCERIAAELDRLRATNAALEKELAEYRAAVGTDDVIWPAEETEPEIGGRGASVLGRDTE